MAFDAQGAPRPRPHSEAALKIVVPPLVCVFPLLFLSFPVIYWHLLQQKKLLKTQKASLLPCEGQGLDREHVNADPLAHPFVA